MAGIQTEIGLQDYFTDVLYGIVSSVNLAVASMYDMQQAMNADIETTSLECAMNEINQVAAAMTELNETLSGSTAPVMPTVQPVQPEPVEIPVQWETEGLRVFSDTGIDRFQQEVQSTNTMLEQLSSTQDAIARQAYNTNLLPPEAFQDLNRLAVRIDMVSESIQQIENNPLNMGTDLANSELERLRSQLNQAVQQQSELNAAMQNMDVGAANDAYLRLSQTIGGTERYIRDNIDEQGRFNQEIQEGVSQADDLMDTIQGAVAAYISIQSIGNVLGVSDELTQTMARLNLMNDGAQTTQELFNMIYASAKSTHAPIMTTADAIAKIGNNAGVAFDSNTELIAFMEQVNKQFAIGGATATEQSNALLQLSQAMAAGALRGDELNSILDAAPGIARTIEQNMGWAEGSIKSYAEEGAVTAEVVKSSLLNMADVTNAAFESMPITFSQAMTDLQTDAVEAFQPVLQRLNEIANSEAFQYFVNGAIAAIETLADIALNTFDLVGTVGGFVADNWSVIGPIIYGVATILALYYGWQLLCAAATGIMAVVQGTLNSAMYACPIVWIIVMVVALIAALVLLWDNCEGFRNFMVDMWAKQAKTLYSFYNNAVVPVANAVISVQNNAVNRTADFCRGIINLFANLAIAVIENMDMVVDAIGGMLQVYNTVAEALGKNTIDIDYLLSTDGINNMREQALNAVDSAVNNLSYQPLQVLDLDKINQFIDTVADSARDFRVTDFVNNLLSDLFSADGIPNPDDYLPEDYSNDLSAALDNSAIGGGIDDIAGNTSSIADAMDITQEDLKYLRDLAEQEAVNRYTVAEIEIDMSGMQNNINSGDDIDGFLEKLTDSVNETVDNMTEGVH